MYVHLVLYTMTNDNINFKLISYELIRTFYRYMRYMPTFHSVLALIFKLVSESKLNLQKTFYSFIKNLR